MVTRRLRTPVDLGIALRDARLARGETQASVAARAGVSREWLIGVERGARPRAELQRILEVARALEVSLEALLPSGPSADDARTPPLISEGPTGPLTRASPELLRFMEQRRGDRP